MVDAGLHERAVAVANERWGRVDSLIVNHGTLDPVKKVGESSVEEWREGFDVNVFSAVGLVSRSNRFFTCILLSCSFLVFKYMSSRIGAYMDISHPVPNFPYHPLPKTKKLSRTLSTPRTPN
jgi:NAD(P)-dependent dehydrogenase (short-subunit alcohol dehydrogenase family)